MPEESGSSEHPCRILSLDGGGIRGLFTAAFLTHLEKHLNQSILKGFDLLTGTSTGGIIALALGMGIPSGKILELYQGLGKEIFGRPRSIRQGWRPKYSNESLKNTLQNFFKDLTLKDSKVPVCITTHELVEGTPRVIKTNHSKVLHWGGDQLAWKVALATSAAPTYFPAAQIGEHDCYVDGGIWANNPIMIGIIEAMRYLNRDIKEIKALSIGTGSEAFRLAHKKAERMGKAQWALRALDLILGAQSIAANNQAKLLLSNDRLLRIQPDLNGPCKLDDYEGCKGLIARGEQAAQNNLNRVREMFFS